MGERRATSLCEGEDATAFPGRAGVGRAPAGDWDPAEVWATRLVRVGRGRRRTFRRATGGANRANRANSRAIRATFRAIRSGEPVILSTHFIGPALANEHEPTKKLAEDY